MDWKQFGERRKEERKERPPPPSRSNSMGHSGTEERRRVEILMKIQWTMDMDN